MLFFTAVTIAQTSKDTLVAATYFKKADSLLKHKNHTASIALFDQALGLYQKAASWERVASCYNKLSENLWRSHALEKSIQQAQKALAICTTHLTENHPEAANAYQNIGDYYERKGEYKQVLPNYEKALAIRKKVFPAFHESIAESYSNIGISHYYTGKNKKAITYFKKAIEIYQKALGATHQKIGNIYNNIGVIYDGEGKNDAALMYYEKALAIYSKHLAADHLHMGYNYANISNVSRLMDQLYPALTYAEKALAIFEKQQDTIGLAGVYTNIGTIYNEKGQHNKAIAYHKKGLHLGEQFYGEDHIELVTNYINILGVYENSEVEKVMFYSKKALRILQKVYGEKNRYTAIIYHNLGLEYTYRKEYTTALEYLQKSLNIRTAILDKNHEAIVSSYYYMAELYKEQHAYEKALAYYQKGIAIVKRSGRLSELLPKCYMAIGAIHYKQQQFEKALQYYEKALVSNTKKRTDSSKDQIFTPDDYYFVDRLFDTLLEKAKTLEQLYQKHKGHDTLHECFKIYAALDQLVTYFRQSYQNYKDKIDLAAQAKEMYAHAITLHITSYSETKDHNHLEKAFYYTERSKSNILKALFRDSNAKVFTELPEEVVRLETVLKSNHAFYQSQIAQQQGKDSVDVAFVEEYENKLFDNHRRQDSLVAVLEKEYPKYYELKYDHTQLSVPEIQAMMNATTTVLDFFVAADRVYVFVISKHAFSVKELQVADLHEKVVQLNTAITSENNEAYTRIAHALYREMIQPVRDEITGDALVIIPDGSLWHMNFDLLLTQEADSQNARAFAYLLREYAISYANSADLLFDTVSTPTQHADLRDECLAFSFSDTATTTTETMSLAALRDIGYDLPGTREEIKSISEIFDGQYFYGAAAKEANFKKNSDRYKIIHLALHAELDTQFPQRSKLYFNTVRDSIEDNLLYAHELFALKIPAELTVLSACNTGVGKVANGEGIMSLGNAFRYAGTQSLLLSSWEVSDKTTPALMKYFYANLKAGMGKAKALQQAKLSYLSTAEAFYTKPFYWGSFYLLGDTNPVTDTDSMRSYILLGLVSVLCLLGIVVFLIKRKKAKVVV